MRNIYIPLILVFTTLNIGAQGWQTEAVIENLREQKIYLSAYQKSDFVIIDSTYTTNGSFYFSTNKDMKGGMYRLSFSSPEMNKNSKATTWFIDYIWRNENVSVFADFHHLSNSVSFENSIENELLNYFREYEKKYEQKMSALFAVTDRYPEEDSYYIQTKNYLSSLQKERDSTILQLVSENADLFASSIIASYRTAFIPNNLIGKERERYMKDHYFDIAPIDNPDLLNAPIYSRKIINYLSLYGNQDFTFTEQENAFIEAVDIVMANTAGDRELRSFAVEFLIEGFESFGMENVQTHILENYMDETCTTDAIELAKHRIERFKKMAVGQQAKDIHIRSYNNKMVQLSDTEADYTLVLFWATHCEHCMKMMPKLIDWYENDRPDNIEIFAISIDTVKNNWLNYLAHTDIPWMNAHEALGWEGRSAEDYNIYATPSMFLLDKNRKIVARPFNVRDLKKIGANLD